MKPRYRILTNCPIIAGDWVLFNEGYYEVMSVEITVSTILFKYKLMDWEKRVERRLIGTNSLSDWYPILKLRQI